MSTDTQISTSWHTYPHIVALGHASIRDLLTVDVNVEEKIDGSQFSFGRFPELAVNGDPELRIRSKGAVMHPDVPVGLFKLAVEAVKERYDLLQPGWTYRAEVLAKPKHNTLAYDRVPRGHVIIYDINTSHEGYLKWQGKVTEATRINFECVPLIYQGRIKEHSQFREFLNTTSVLGGQQVEGVVIKPTNYDLFGADGKCLMGKFVSEAFKEAHSRAWKEGNPSAADIIQFLQTKYCVPARWNKAIQHRIEDGKMLFAPQDIGPLIMSITKDVEAEEKTDITEDLWRYAWPHIRRGLARGFPEYFKELLLRRQFELGESNGAEAICIFCQQAPCDGSKARCPNNPNPPAYVEDAQ